VILFFGITLDLHMLQLISCDTLVTSFLATLFTWQMDSTVEEFVSLYCKGSEALNAPCFGSRAVLAKSTVIVVFIFFSFCA